MSPRHGAARVRGFSIIEIAVVLVVLGMLMSAAMPNISSWLRNTHLRNQAEATLTGLQQARNEAVRRNRTVSFWLVSQASTTAMSDECVLSATGTSWVVSVNDPTSHCASAPSTSTSPRIVATRLGADGSAGVSVNATDADGNAATSVTFDGFGRAVTGSVTQINVAQASEQTGDRPLRILISTSGQTRLCDVSVTEGSDPRKCPEGTYR
ncbi:MAG: hypothetical protein RI907_860 [Pseudomonadota bacterium]|jgi:type IV fimbrial biogenesis protein FimT